MCNAVCRNITNVCVWQRGKLSPPEIIVHAMFRSKIACIFCSQCVLFIWESTSDGLLLKTVDLAGKSCLLKKANTLRNRKSFEGQEGSFPKIIFSLLSET